jgi:hypothetical protein
MDFPHPAKKTSCSPLKMGYVGRSELATNGFIDDCRGYRRNDALQQVPPPEAGACTHLSLRMFGSRRVPAGEFRGLPRATR